jgi:membrane protease YdiL (CAAX protease family)
MTRMAEAWGRRTGILASSAFFSILHYSWWLPLGSVSVELIAMFTFNLFLGGIVLGVSYYLSGEKLWVPIAFHFTWNVLAYVLFPVFPAQPVSSPILWQIEWGLTTVLGFLFGLCLIWSLIAKHSSRERH